jgi:2-amino-4-hydroxy-6-hydroxymethyldihydropteridine diphosphokinase
MRYELWEPIYLDILKEFGYSRERDEEAARLLDSLAQEKSICLEPCLQRVIEPKVTVCGNAPELRLELLKYGVEGTLIAADGATSEIMEQGMIPDLIVTDLDGEIGDQQRSNEKGAIVVVHAHGDNMQKLRCAVPGFHGELALTTQSSPVGRVRDYGGFTDGDRAVELARHFGAQRIRLLGFDFEHPRPKAGSDPNLKLRKLRWSRRIIMEINPPQVALWFP